MPIRRLKGIYYDSDSGEIVALNNNGEYEVVGAAGVDGVTGDLVAGTATDPTVDVASMTAAGALTGSELVPIIQGTKKKTTTQDIANLAPGGSSATSLILTSPDNTQWEVTVNDEGVLITTAI